MWFFINRHPSEIQIKCSPRQPHPLSLEVDLRLALARLSGFGGMSHEFWFSRRNGVILGGNAIVRVVDGLCGREKSVGG